MIIVYESSEAFSYAGLPFIISATSNESATIVTGPYSIAKHGTYSSGASKFGGFSAGKAQGGAFSAGSQKSAGSS